MNISNSVGIKVFRKNKDAALPEFATGLASGMDLRAVREVELKPKCVGLIETGLFMEIPGGYEGQIRSKSGLAVNYGVFVLNSPGTVDADYRGEIKVILFNTSDNFFFIKKGMKIAQLVICQIPKPILVEVENYDELSQTGRGEGGFGSTGI